MSEEKKDLKIKLKDDKGKYYEVISTEQFNIQEELNKEIEINIKYKEVLDKVLYWLSENTHYTDFNVDKLVLDENANLKELLEILEEIE